MGLDAEDRVRADQLERVRGDPPHGLLGRVVLEHGHVQLRLAQELEHELDRHSGVGAAQQNGERLLVLSQVFAPFSRLVRVAHFA